MSPQPQSFSPHLPEGTPISAIATTYRAPLTARRLIGMVMIIACGWLAFAIFSQVVHGAGLNSQVRTLAAQNDALRQQISDRQKEISEAQSPAWLEEEARQLGYVMPGEKVYVLTAPGSSPPAGGGVNATLPSFNPSPSPSPSQTPPAPAPGATPTPYTFTLSSPPPSR